MAISLLFTNSFTEAPCRRFPLESLTLESAPGSTKQAVLSLSLIQTRTVPQYHTKLIQQHIPIIWTTFNYSSWFTCRQLNSSNIVSWKQTCEDLSYICTFKGYSSLSLCRKLEFNPSRAEQLQMLQYCASCVFPMTKDSACSAFSLWKNRNRYFNRLLLSDTPLLVNTSEYKFLCRIC